MSLVSIVCKPGGHTGVFDDANASVSPPGWRRVTASQIPDIRLGPDDPWRPGIWYVDPKGTPVWCCPNHQPLNTRSIK